MNPNTAANVLEKDLAAQLQLDRRLLTRLRKSELAAGEDWVESPGEGIYLTESGAKKIRAALPAPPAAEQAPAPVMIRIHRLCPNPLVVEGEPIDGQRVLIRLLRGPSPLYRPGMELEGCSKRPGFTEQWDYPGPKPRFVGRF